MAIRVLIIDDSLVVRQLLESMLNDVADIEVVGLAEDPYDAREQIKQLNPDVLTLDIEMPKMDGLTFLEKIMTLRPMPVVMVSTLTKKGASETLRALELGAIDYISKPAGRKKGDPLTWMKEELVQKIRVAFKANLSGTKKTGATTEDTPSIVEYTPDKNSPEPIIAFGSSTGGVEALREIFLRLPENSPPIVMAQHMPAQFTESLAKRLNSISNITVQQAQHGLRLQSGHAYLAPGDAHLKIAKQGDMIICRLDDGPEVSGHKPSVDVLFESAASATGGNSIGVILTGMGSDGAEGIKKMHDAGAYTIAQNQSSCVVYGMPKAAVEAGGIKQEVSLTQIPEVIFNYIASRK